MPVSIIPYINEIDHELSTSVSCFIKDYKINQLLHICRAEKEKGIPAITVFQYLLCLIFADRSMYMRFKTNIQRDIVSLPLAGAMGILLFQSTLLYLQVPTKIMYLGCIRILVNARLRAVAENRSSQRPQRYCSSFCRQHSMQATLPDMFCLTPGFLLWKIFIG